MGGFHIKKGKGHETWRRQESSPRERDRRDRWGGKNRTNLGNASNSKTLGGPTSVKRSSSLKHGKEKEKDDEGVGGKMKWGNFDG